MEKAGALRLSTMCFNFIFIMIYKTEMDWKGCRIKKNGRVIVQDRKSKEAMEREVFDYIFFDQKTMTDDNVPYLG